jgi:uncharacterized protein YqhQ
MAWLGASSHGGFEIRGEEVVLRADARGVRLARQRGCPKAWLLLPLAAPAFLLLLPPEAVALLGLVLLLALLAASPLLVRGFARWRRWHGAEHRVVEAVLLLEEGVPPEEAWERAPFLSPHCGTVAVGMALPLAPVLYLLHPFLVPLALPLALVLHLRLPSSSPLRFPGLLLQRLVAARPGPLEEARAREAVEALHRLLMEGR